MRRAIDERPRQAIATAAAALVLVVATVLITSSLRGASAEHGRAMRADRRAASQTATVHRLQRSSRVRTRACGRHPGRELQTSAWPAVTFVGSIEGPRKR